MRAHELTTGRTFGVTFDHGEDFFDALSAFCRDQGVRQGYIPSFIGAFAEAVLGYFDWEKKDYISNVIHEQVEVASLIGDVALSPSGEPMLHIHVVLGRRDGTALAGHLQKAHVRPTLEVILNESPAHLQKVHDPQSGLALIRPKQ